MFRYLLILLFISSYYSSNLYGQNLNVDRSINLRMPPDSIFVKFIPPKTPKELFGSSGYYKEYFADEFYILCFALVDTNGYLKQFSRYPVYNAGNDIKPSSRIWKKILKSIDEVSKQWQFKPIAYNYYKESDTLHKELIEYIKQVNDKKIGPYQRPYKGMQQHMFLLSLKLPYQHSYYPQFLYWIESYQTEED